MDDNPMFRLIGFLRESSGFLQGSFFLFFGLLGLAFLVAGWVVAKREQREKDES